MAKVAGYTVERQLVAWCGRWRIVVFADRLLLSLHGGIRKFSLLCTTMACRQQLFIRSITVVEVFLTFSGSLAVIPPDDPGR
jgi:hypothetical protein